MTGSSPRDSGDGLTAVAPRRLAVAPERRLPKSVTDEGHKRVVQQALGWQQSAIHAKLWEAGATAQTMGEDRAYALAGQMASAGERLALAHAGAVEVGLWQELREEAEPDPAHEMSMRGMAEAQCLFVMGAGHALANVAVRALALHPNLRSALSNKFRGSPTFEPFSNKQSDWVSLNPETCRKIRAVARSSDAEEVIQLVEPVAAFGAGKRWQALVEKRGEDFHRWRLQTHGIEGVPQTSPWRREGRSRTMDLGHPVYEEARGLADHVAGLATEAMLDLTLSMEAFMERWPDASGHLGGPKFEA